MRTFKDNAGRTWTVSVDVDAIRRVRTALQVNLASAELAQVLERLLSDPVLLCDVLFVVCKPEADKLGVSDVDFGRAMAGDAIEAGTLALLEELANFTPNPRDRARVKRLLQAMQQLAERTRDAAETRLEREIENALSATTATSGPSSGSSPASSASTPVP
ncbi:MAG: hypothetical protein HS116_18650 [Planctomycetes bacterium]|nr:hypothetical protein [Planctomycetota bacterium]